MRRVAAFVLAALTVMACTPGTLATVGPGGESRPGNPDVYERIESETDCAALQEEFDTAEAGPPSEWKVPYMEAADARMRELGCYD